MRLLHDCLHCVFLGYFSFFADIASCHLLLHFFFDFFVCVAFVYCSCLYVALQGLAQRVVRGDVPTTLRCRIISLDMVLCLSAFVSFPVFRLSSVFSFAFHVLIYCSFPATGFFGSFLFFLLFFLFLHSLRLSLC